MKTMVSSNEIGFSKAMLWHLASIQADVYQNQVLLVEILARQAKKPAKTVQKQWKKKSDEMRLTRYWESLAASGIGRDTNPKPEENQTLPWWVDVP